MALTTIQRIPVFYSSITIFTQNHKPKKKTRISCSSNGISDGSLASELAAKASRMKARVVQADEAMRKSRKLLFGEICEYMGGVKEEDAKLKWNEMGEEEKLVLVKGFVAEWGAHFHPLSAKSTKQMLDEYLQQQPNDSPNPPPPPPSPSFLFPGFKRIIGFP